MTSSLQSIKFAWNMEFLHTTPPKKQLHMHTYSHHTRIICITVWGKAASFSTVLARPLQQTQTVCGLQKVFSSMQNAVATLQNHLSYRYSPNLSSYISHPIYPIVKLHKCINSHTCVHVNVFTICISWINSRTTHIQRLMRIEE